jgi:phosphoserine phosphatase
MDDRTPTILRLAEALKASGEPSPIVCTDADGTLWDGDAGVEFARWLVDKGALPQGVLEEYERRFVADVTGAYVFLTRAMAGQRERDVAEYAAYFVERVWRRRLFPEVVELVAGLERQGAAVWVLSASNRWIIEEAARWVGVSRSRVLGMSVKVDHGALTDELDGPALNGPGKLEAIDRFIGRRPVAVLGNSVHDLAMLEAATGAALLVNPSSHVDPALGTSLRALGYRNGWIVLDLEGRSDGT